MKYFLTVFVILGLFGFLSYALADTITTGDGATGLPNPLSGVSDISDLIKKIVDWLIGIGAPIAVGMIVWGAFQMIFSSGDTEKFSKGKNTILYAVIGYAIILIGWGITAIIRNFLSS